MRDQRIARLAMGKMAAAIVRDARDAACRRDSNAPSAERLVVWSGHDSTLFGLLSVFALEAPATWPPYAAQMHVELLEECTGRERPRGWYVRFSLNGDALACALGSESTGSSSSTIVALDDVVSAVIGGPE